MALEQRAIGRRIAELREDRRLTQPVMAERVGVSLRAYQKWEAGTAAPNWRNLEQLAEVLGITADELIGAGNGQRHEPVAVQLHRIEQKLDAVLTALGVTPDAAAEAVDQLAEEVAQQDARRSARSSGRARKTARAV